MFGIARKIPYTSFVSRIRQKSAGAKMVRSMAKGDKIADVAAKIDARNSRHGDAVATASCNAFEALAAKPALAKLDWSKVHLTHVVYAAGARPTTSQLPTGVRGTQLGAAAFVRGSNGALHAYALVFVR